jgi:ATP-binding cassette subfamily B protein
VRIIGDLVSWTRFMRTALGSVFPVFCVLRTVQSLAGTLQPLAIALVLGAVLRGDQTFAPLAVLAGCLMATSLLQVLIGGLVTLAAERVQSNVKRQILEAAMSMPTVDHLDDAQTTDRLAFLNHQSWRLANTAWVPLDLFVTVLNFLAVAALLWNLEPIFVLLPALGIGRVVAATRAARHVDEAQIGASAHVRRSAALRAAALNPDHAVELRVYEGYGIVLDAIRAADAAAGTTIARARRHAAWQDAGGRLGFGALYCAVLAMLVQRASIASSISAITAVVLLILLLARIERVSSGLVSGSTQLGQLRSFLRELQDFARPDRTKAENRGTVAGRPAGDDPGSHVPGTPFGELVVEGLGYRYPEQETFAVRNLDVRIPSGSTVAVVGSNGSGKSTLVECLLGLRTPTEGSCRYNVPSGPSTTGFTQQDNTVGSVGQSSASLQNAALFELPLAQAVCLDTVDRTERAMDQIWPALSAAKVDYVPELVNGVWTQLGTHREGGRALSGGQWQRLVNATAIFHDRSRLLVLDEPTSAVDPRVEEETLQSLLTAGRMTARSGGIAVIVSHRLAVTATVDQIIVLDQGAIVECGSHSDLMAANGLYRRMYSRQRDLYTGPDDPTGGRG